MKQKKIVCFLTILSVLLISQSLFAQEQNSKQKSSVKTNSGLVYQCESHAGVISNNPGSCNKCGEKLKALTMDEAMDNLSGKAKKKPELKATEVYPHRREKGDTLNSAEIAEENVESSKDGDELEEEETGHNHSAEHEKNVKMTDLNRDGFVYQCPKCPGEMSDQPYDCEECFSTLVKVTVEEAMKNVPVCDH